MASLTDILALIKTAIGIAKGLIDTGKDAAPVIKAIFEFLKKDNKTDAEIAEFRDEIDHLRAELHAPLPDPEPGEQP